MDAIIQGTYADLKLIKTRSVAQIVIEIPIEQAQSAVQMLGIPQPGRETSVAIARLQDTGTAPRHGVDNPVAEAKSSDKPRALSQIVALTCTNNMFVSWISKRYQRENVSNFVREWCGVASRSEITEGSEAAKKWKTLYDSFYLESRGYA